MLSAGSKSVRRMITAGLIAFSGGCAFAGQQTVPEERRVDADASLYSQHCASCHGARGEGASGWREPNEQGDLPSPPHDATGHSWRHADAVLYEMIAKGWRDPFNKTETLTMPAFGGVLTPKEIAAVIAYLKTLWTPEQRRLQAEESQARLLPPEAR